MQTLSERAAAEDCGQHYFQFTAIETTEKEKVEETGKQLQSFAAQFNLPFSFNVLYIPDLKHLKAEQVEIKADEAVVIHASFVLRAMISKPLELESDESHHEAESLRDGGPRNGSQSQLSLIRAQIHRRIGRHNAARRSTPGEHRSRVGPRRDP
nr:DELLA protein RGL1-like [Ipomoea batatas]